MYVNGGTALSCEQSIDVVYWPARSTSKTDRRPTRPCLREGFNPRAGGSAVTSWTHTF